MQFAGQTESENKVFQFAGQIDSEISLADKLKRQISLSGKLILKIRCFTLSGKVILRIRCFNLSGKMILKRKGMVGEQLNMGRATFENFKR